jgi:hypothetical protein
MKFLLHRGASNSTIRQIGDHLRAHGAGRHWIERYHGDVYLFASDPRDELVLKQKFKDLLEVVGDDKASKS